MLLICAKGVGGTEPKALCLGLRSVCSEQEAILILEKFFHLTQEILASGRVKQDQIQGLSEHKIQAFQQHKGFKFPKVYSAFLSFCGESGAEEFTGLDFKMGWDDVTRQEIAFQSQDEGAIVPVIYKGCVFFSGDGHGGFYYFVSEFGEDDPEVFRWDDYSEVRPWSRTFSDFVFSETLNYDLIKQKYFNR
jgi:SMI1 / KNR4 family (SUKH-1)